jgi:hypothetical protein
MLLMPEFNMGILFEAMCSIDMIPGTFYNLTGFTGKTS